MARMSPSGGRARPASAMTENVAAEELARTYGIEQGCDWEGCQRMAVAAIRFRDQPGHTHDCGPHLAQLREWCDITETAPMPCPWPHGNKWTDDPAPLDYGADNLSPAKDSGGDAR